ncbi:MAG: DUF63 family protein [Euryarchaeota archaeon]|nr:DUF63 family protein [Euryarchaeota archaeon]
MSDVDEIHEILSHHKPCLPSKQYHPLEKVAIWSVLALFTAIAVGLTLFNEVVWVETLKPIIWDPILKDAGVAGDAGYTPQNTAIYTSSMFICVIVLQAVFRKLQLPADDRMTLALIAWVSLAPILRVLEDADFYSSEVDWLFISPVIHLHLTTWLVVIALISHYLAGKWDLDSGFSAESRKHTTLFSSLGLLLFAHWTMLYRPAYSEHPQMGSQMVIIGLMASFTALYFILIKTRGWPALTRGMFSFAVAAIVMGLSHWGQFIITPWQQESGMNNSEITLWPILIVIGIPAIVCYWMYKKGIEDARLLKSTGFDAGVLPEGVSLKSWEFEEELVKDHPIERLSNNALLASPMVIAMVFGQLVDGFATMMGIDFFGYGEKHPVSNGVIEIGGEVNQMLGISFGEGAWLFTILKACLVGLIAWMFVQMRVENRQTHLRQLIVLAVLIVGLAPGLRDIGRLVLGV